MDLLEGVMSWESGEKLEGDCSPGPSATES